MGRVDNIKAPIIEELEAFEDRFRKSMKSKVPLLDKITHFIIKRKGKQMRPMFVFLSAKAVGNISDGTFRAASLIELLHTATLVHDDVIDDAMERRSFFSINALWKNKIAVLVGDYLLSKLLVLAIDHNEFELLRIVSTSVKKMSEGELLQLEKSRGINLNEEVYLNIIEQKTASLISTCCHAGATSATDNEEHKEALKNFGTQVGMAFQIKDDLFDYGTDAVGKPLGIDIKEKKVTLPLLYALNNCSWLERKQIIFQLKNHRNKRERIQKIIDFVIEKGGIEYAKTKMLAYRDAALECIKVIPESEAKSSLIDLVQYTIERTK
ncbi:polyprenyl synthetase family protein [Luteibaculum oceani]|uniref:Polyprenyl synthetase family protein n=1 Tax=Luteibaculum oceani TaxID=1294296 RepID=A0A5C6VI42_9FLAO|nr:polyprenyl synthetase family protein [Luteibaculum oceani]TXC85112.1 polyprenyl synthetase family protein [Luteibaculum oceani]